MMSTTKFFAGTLLAVAMGLSTPVAADAVTTASNHDYIVVTAAMPHSMVQAAQDRRDPVDASLLSPVGSRWQDYLNRLVTLRIEAQNKIFFKHNLDRTAVRVATQHPDRGRPEFGTAWEYYTTFLKIEPGGRVSASQLVRTVAEFREPDGDPQGIITSYCEGVQGACPGWINETIG